MGVAPSSSSLLSSYHKGGAANTPQRFIVRSKNNGRRYRLDTDELLQSAGGSTLFSLYNGSCLDDDAATTTTQRSTDTKYESDQLSGLPIPMRTSSVSALSSPSSPSSLSPPSSPPGSLSTSPDATVKWSNSTHSIPAMTVTTPSSVSLPRVSFFVFCKAEVPQLASSLHTRDYDNTKDSDDEQQEQLSADALLDAARNYVLRMKKNRHPHIGRYIESIENKSVVAIITEHLIPLSTVFGRLTLTEVRLGLFQLFSGIHFLHVEGGISHNNLTLSSIFIRPSTNEWCLGGFEFAGNANSSVGSSSSSSAFRSHAEVSSLCKRDTWAIGSLLQEVLSHLVEPQKKGGNQENNASDPPSESGGVLLPLKELVQRLLRTPTTGESVPEGLTCEGAMVSPFFADDEVLEISNFLSNITLKSPLLKKQFFQSLPIRLKSFIYSHNSSGESSEETVGKIIIPRLMSPQVLMDPFVHLCLPIILSPIDESSSPPSSEHEARSGLLHESAYQVYILPYVCSAFSSRDSNIRQTLLRHTKYFFPYIRPPSKQAEIFKEMLLGLKDKSNALVLSTLSGLQTVVLLWTESSDYVPTNIDTLISLQLNQIRDLLRDEDECIRAAALEHMSELIGSYEELQRNVIDICDMIKDSSSSVRISSLRAIRRIKNKITPKKMCVEVIIPSLLICLQDVNAEIRHLAEAVICELVTIVASSQPPLPKTLSSKESSGITHSSPSSSPSTTSAVVRRPRIFTGAVFSPSQNLSLINGDELVLLDSLGKQEDSGDEDYDDDEEGEPIAEGYLREEFDQQTSTIRDS